MNFDTISVQEAVRRSLQTEKNAMDFYRMGALKMQDHEARRVFEILAGEERGHAGIESVAEVRQPNLVRRRLGQESPTLVVTDRFDPNSPAARELADRHARHVLKP